MNNTERLGPAPAPDPPPAGGPRALILDALRGASTPQSVRDLAATIDVHANTVRTALAELTEAEQVSREPLPSTGRGRPTYGYSITQTGRNTAPARPAFREYRGLTGAFAAHLARCAEDPGAAARDIGRSWGRSLAADAAAETSGPPTGPQEDPAGSARSRVVRLLGELGFSPTRDAGGLALRTCPLLDLAEEMPDVICQVHQGLLDGAMDHYGDSTSRSDLRPFAEVGACRLSFHPEEAPSGAARSCSGKPQNSDGEARPDSNSSPG